MCGGRVSELLPPLPPLPPHRLPQGFPPSKNDFLFERRLSEHVYCIILDHSKGRPTLVFCR